MMIKKIILPAFLIVSGICFLPGALTAQGEQVSAKTFNKNFPTYQLGPEQSMPYLKDFDVPGIRFFRGSRSVYPYTFINDYMPGKKDREYEVVRLENEFIYVDIIPELRGRIQGAVDKRNGWDFLYYNNVIKPAEISVRSAWISGGLEFNHPQGHGYTQFDKISYDILEGEDGSKTIVIAEIEPIRMMKWEFEITLKPGTLYLETKGRLMSTVPYPVPFLSSNNPALHTSEEMELIYPQETWASGHGFRNVRKWPYYGNDSANWNWLKNIKTQASAFVDGTGLYLDYWGVYSHDEGIDAGSVIVSDHRTAPGKKFFTWGSHDFGKQWDYFLSDEDGGYVELQQQAYYANLGYGSAVLDPFEVKEFSIFWYPVKGTGGFVKATKDVVLNFNRIDNDNVEVILQPTSDLMDNTIEIYNNGVLVNKYDADLPVGEIYSRKFRISSQLSDTLKVRLVGANGNELIWYADKIDEIKPEIERLPNVPDSELTIDQLYSKGLSDYHDPFSLDAERTLLEILKRDSLESRANRQLGIIMASRGQYPEAIRYLRTSLKNDHFESCYRTHLLMGYSFLKLGDLTNAHIHLVQSSRKKSELESSLYYLAQVEILRDNLPEAQRYMDEIPVSRLTHPDIYVQKAYISRKLGNTGKAIRYIEDAFRIDPLCFAGVTEKLWMDPGNEDLINKVNFLFDRRDKTFLGSQLYLETAEFYLGLNDYPAALDILSLAEDHFKTTEFYYPFIDYYIGYCLMNLGQQDKAREYYRKASARDYTYVFPYRKTSVKVLQNVLDNYPEDPVALMYYGDLMYYLRQFDEAITAWEKSYRLDQSNPQTVRNLGISHFVKTQDSERTVSLLEEAFRRDRDNLRIFNELEQIYVLREDYESLEKLYDENWKIITRKADFALSCADLYLSKGRYDDVLKIMEGTFFNAVERSAGQPVRYSRYTQAEIGLGEGFMQEKKYEQAIEHFQKAYEYPGYLNEVKVEKPVTVRLDYLMGMAHKLNGQDKEAKEYFKKAIDQEYNELSVDAIYRARALSETGEQKQGKEIVTELLEQLDDPGNETSIERSNRRSGGRSSAVRVYLKGLAYGYLGDSQKEQEFIDTALKMDRNVVYRARFESSFIRVRRR
jgi:tetratricopeptide (TPR) repeat protein